MKVEIHRESFLAALSAVAGVCPARSPKPILSNVKFVCGESAPDDGPVLMATDLEIGILFRVGGVRVVEGGAVVLPPVKLREILSRATCETLTIESDGEKTKIRGAKCKFDLPSEDPDLYPDPMGFDAKDHYTVAGMDLHRLVSLTMFAVDEESTKYAMGGVLCELRPDSIVMASTDGRRVAEAKASCSVVGSPKTYVNKATEDKETTQAPVVPAKALRLLKGLLGHAKATDAPVAIAIGKNRTGIAFQSEQATFTTRVMEGTFPRYQAAFPDSAVAHSRVELTASDFADAVGQAAIATSQETRGVSMHFTTGLVRLSAQAADVGSSDVELDLPGFEGPEVKVTFDGSYLTDALRAIGPDATIQADFRPKEGSVFTVDDVYRYCCMPLVMG